MSTIKYFHVFRSKCYILANGEPRRKLDAKSDEGIFLGYSTNNKAFRVFNSRTKVMMEPSNVIIDYIEDDVSEEVKIIIPAEDVIHEENFITPTTNVVSSSADSEVEEPHVSDKGPSLKI